MRRPTGFRAAVLAAAVLVMLFPASVYAFNPNDCDGRRPTIWGTPKGDRLVGTPKADVFRTLGGDDVVFGRAGDDVVCGGGGADRISGGKGNDSINGEGGDDSLLGGLGDDSLEGGFGNDSLNGGEGVDKVTMGSSFGDVTADLGSGTATGEGSDILIGLESLSGGHGDDTLIGNGEPNALFGVDGDDLLVGGHGDDLLDGGAGWDTVSFEASLAGVAADLVQGTSSGDGSDVLTALEHIRGSPFNDVFVGDAVHNVIHADAGDDNLSGGDGPDVLYGGEGDDTILGGIGNDFLYGEAGTDALDGGLGMDLCITGESDLGCETFYIGDWVGTTSQGQELRFSVDGFNAVTSFGFDLITATCTGTFFLDDFRAQVVDDRFDFTGEDLFSSWHITGGFSSPVAASGEIELDPPPGCGSTVSVTWQATLSD